MRVTIAQLNPTVGDIEGNLGRISETLVKFNKGSDLIIFPELFIVGYPPRDLLYKPEFVEDAEKAVQKLIKLSARYPQTGLLVGAPVLTGKSTGKGLYNSALLIHNGKVVMSQPKSLLPTYDVFDEARYFDSAPDVRTVKFKGQTLGISICEDAWSNPKTRPSGGRYSFDPISVLAEKGATLFINISSSPFYVGKEENRYRLMRAHAKKHGVPFVYVNQVGGNDELIFDGRSMCIDGRGDVVEVFPSFKEHVQTVDLGSQGKRVCYAPQDRIESVCEALSLGIRDYMRKCGFSRAVVGLSGGVDSAVTGFLASKAVGSKNVLGVFMPSPYSSEESMGYSRRLAKNLGLRFEVISISQVYDSYIRTLKEPLRIRGGVDVAMENVQARIRGNILMALSNKFGYLVLSTGNKSEMAVGYCTLYGDMSGGLAVISDVPKTMVYELARYINRTAEVIPNEIIERPPSAELKPNQTDQDTLPPYSILDKVLHYYIEDGLSVEAIAARGFESDVVKWVVHAVNRSEYKRGQAPPGLKVTTKAFGVGRRMPIAAKYEK